MKIACMELSLKAITVLRLPAYKGSTFRGAFGHALKKAVCIVNHRNCERCIVRRQCAYTYLFETFNSQNQYVAHPYIIIPPLQSKDVYHPGEELNVHIKLIGKAIDYIPHVILAFKRMGMSGVGTTRGHFELVRVNAKTISGLREIYNSQQDRLLTDQNYPEIGYWTRPNQAPDVNRVRLHFITPTALKDKGEVTRHIGSELLFRSIKRRLKALSVYHNGPEVENGVYEFDNTGELEWDNSGIEPCYWQRYSNRQNQKIGFEGVLGTIEVRGNLEPFMPLLSAGSVIHVGRGTVYGMGLYELEVMK